MDTVMLEISDTPMMDRIWDMFLDGQGWIPIADNDNSKGLTVLNQDRDHEDQD